jgi:PIN domain nuclease of toxin-antitoxin system
MGAVIYLDTHVVVWLYAGQVELLPKSVMLRLEAADLKISPIVALELEYLHEIGRLSVPGVQVVRDLALQIGLVTCDLPFATVIEHAAQQAWTRDPFDRIIVAHAAATGNELATKDRVIHQHCSLALWESA